VNETGSVPAVGAASTRLANSERRTETAEEADSATALKRPTKTSKPSKRALVVLKFSLVKTDVWTMVSGSRFVITSYLSFRYADGLEAGS
jgi:hypothetical protein